MDNRGKQVLFNSPAALAGLKSYFKLLRRVPNIKVSWAPMIAWNVLMQGKAAAVLTDARFILIATFRTESPNRKHRRSQPDEYSLVGRRQPCDLETHLWLPGSPRSRVQAGRIPHSQKHHARAGAEFHILPARADALDELIPPDHPLRPVMIQLVSTGRSYRSIPLWRRIENQFGQELSAGRARHLFEDKDADLDSLLTESMGLL